MSVFRFKLLSILIALGAIYCLFALIEQDLDLTAWSLLCQVLFGGLAFCWVIMIVMAVPDPQEKGRASYQVTHKPDLFMFLSLSIRRGMEWSGKLVAAVKSRKAA